MTANGIEHPDFQNTRKLARRDEETIKQKKIKSPKLGKFRVKKGKRYLLFQDGRADEKFNHPHEGFRAKYF